MKRNRNLELRLVRPSVFPRPAIYGGHYPYMVDKEGGNPGNTQQLTIFYDGRIAVCDATELQARAIIWLASRGAEEKWNESPGFHPPPSPFPASPLYSPSTGMKRSLQRFLQTRRTRVQATSPYPVTRNISN